MTTPTLRGVGDLSDEAERAIQRAAARVGGYVVDGDVAAAISAAQNLKADAEAVLEALSGVHNPIIQDRLPR